MLHDDVFDGDGDQLKPKRSCVFEERVAESCRLLEAGNAAFAAGDARQAKEAFQQGLWHVDFDEASYNFELMDKHRTAVDNCQVKLLLNLSTVLLKRPKAAAGVNPAPAGAGAGASGDRCGGGAAADAVEDGATPADDAGSSAAGSGGDGGKEGKSACYNPTLARTCADEVVRVSKGSSAKGLLRRAEACMCLRDADSALVALDEAERLLAEPAKGCEVSGAADAPAGQATNNYQSKLRKLRARLAKLRKQQADSRKAMWKGKLNTSSNNNDDVDGNGGGKKLASSAAAEKKPTPAEVERATEAATRAVAAAMRQHKAEQTIVRRKLAAANGDGQGAEAKTTPAEGKKEELQPPPTWLKLLMEGMTIAIVAVVYLNYFR